MFSLQRAAKIVKHPLVKVLSDPTTSSMLDLVSAKMVLRTDKQRNSYNYAVQWDLKVYLLGKWKIAHSVS